MNPAITKYYNRFTNNKPVKSDKFFTQYDISEYSEKLPYIFGIESFCSRLYQALIKKEKICIYSDYDTDAVTATATMYWGLVGLGFAKEKIDFYAPDRFTEGYGMNTEAIEMLSQKYDLIISVDCGINSVKEAKIVKNSQNCDLIITDHHHLQDTIPNCITINPRLSKYYSENIDIYSAQKILNLESLDLNENIILKIENWIKKISKNPIEYPTNSQKFLSESVTGVGVAWFCLVWFGYFLEEIQVDHTTKSTEKQLPENQKYLENIFKKINWRGGLNSLLPFVAIGTIADCQSVLEPTNRFLVRAGLQLLQKNQLPFSGLNELLDQTGLAEKITQNYKINSQDLGYTLSPILNSSGRLSHARLSISTLLAPETQTAKDLASKLIQTNQDRKEMVKNILDELEEKASQQFLSNQKMIWIEGSWSKGIVGLLASRLVNQYNLPTIIISLEDSGATASLRAPEGYHLPKAMTQCAELFAKFGGHPGAAGFTTTSENLNNIKPRMSQALEEQSLNLSTQKSNYLPDWLKDTDLPLELQRETSQKKLLWLKSSDLETHLFTEIWSLDPFGQDFPMPVLVFRLSFKEISLLWMGTEKNHLKITFNKIQSLTYFRVSHEQKNIILKLINTESTFWVEAKISQNTWNGNTKNTLIAERLYL